MKYNKDNIIYIDFTFKGKKLILSLIYFYINFTQD